MSVVGSVARLLPCQARQAPASPPNPPKDGLRLDLEVQFNYTYSSFFGSPFAAAQPIELFLLQFNAQQPVPSSRAPFSRIQLAVWLNVWMVNAVLSDLVFPGYDILAGVI